MRLFNRLGRALSLAAALAAGAVWLAGCGDGGNDSTGNPGNNSSARYGTFTDTRDRQIYGMVKTGGKTWMAENMNIDTGNSWCYGGKSANCDAYGRLYDWETAMAACPSGWHLPTRAEWGELAKFAGGRGAYGTDSVAAGKKLKAMRGWNWNDADGVSGNGTDDYGFSALPGGARDTGGHFSNVGNFGGWWTATTEDNNANFYGRNNAYFRYIYNYIGYAQEYYYNKDYGLSVRCVMD